MQEKTNIKHILTFYYMSQQQRLNLKYYTFQFGSLLIDSTIEKKKNELKMCHSPTIKSN